MPEGLRAAASKGEARKASRGNSFIWGWERIIVGPAVPWAETGLVNPDHLRPGQRAFIGSVGCFHERLKHHQGCGDDLNVLLIQSTTYCTTTDPRHSVRRRGDTRIPIWYGRPYERMRGQRRKICDEN